MILRRHNYIYFGAVLNLGVENVIALYLLGGLL